MKKIEEILSSKATQLDTSDPFWGNQKITAAQAIEAMEEYARQNTLKREKVMEILKSNSIKSISYNDRGYPHIPLNNCEYIADAICSLSLPTAQDRFNIAIQSLPTVINSWTVNDIENAICLASGIAKY